MTTVSPIAALAPCSGPTPGADCPEGAWVAVEYSERCAACTRRRAVLNHTTTTRENR